NKIITCIMDSGYCENAVKLSQDADVLIAESAFLEGEKDENWGHLSPDVANRIKIEANAKKLILTHFGADRYNKRR
ncbi:MAG: hypothetical protein N2446_01165, partial [Elusimicrobiales bacterium]|nr:hypothetical protein [Elusimicrobiales bacterium]